MNVKLVGVSHPRSGMNLTEDIMYLALSQCYNNAFDVEEAKSVSREDKERLIRACVKSGHESILEHVSFTFHANNISRVLTHQLVRHRLASYTQQSGRYTEPEQDDWYTIPTSIERNEEALRIFKEGIESTKKTYKKLLDCGVPKEDARFLLPNGQHTSIVFTMNCRELKNFFGLRLCSRAQWEIRELATQMSIICKKELPVVFVDCHAGDPRCIQMGFCVEPRTAWCKRAPHISQLKDK